MRIATVKIQHSKTGAIRIVNASDFDPNDDKNWKVVAERSRADMEASDSATPSAPAPVAASEAEPEAPTEPSEDWTKMKWTDARKFIHDKTGTYPKSKTHAAELMA